MKAGFAMGDLGAGLFGIIGIVSALFERSRTGKGQDLTTSLYEDKAGTARELGDELLRDWHSSMRWDPGTPTSCPTRRIGPPMTTSSSPSATTPWQRLCTAIERPDLGDDERLLANRGRVEHREYLNEELSRTLRTNTVEHWCERFDHRDPRCTDQTPRRRSMPIRRPKPSGWSRRSTIPPPDQYGSGIPRQLQRSPPTRALRATGTRSRIPTTSLRCCRPPTSSATTGA